MKILTVSQMQSLERLADEDGHTYAMMMELAGIGLADIVKSKVSLSDLILILVGPGNNGGDGLVAARTLHTQGYSVVAYLSRVRDPATDSEFAKALDSGVSFLYAEKDNDWLSLTRCVNTAFVIVDALLGTGSTPPIHGIIADILRAVQTALKSGKKPSRYDLVHTALSHQKHPMIISVDGPSGLDFDTGVVDDLTLKSDISITFASPKWGQLTRPGANFVGELNVVDIGTSDYASIDTNFSMATVDLIITWLPKRPADSHKGTFGRAMIVAGSINYTGAAILSAQGALRTGAGLVTLAIPSNLHSAVVSAIPEATYLLLPHTMGIINEQAIPIVKNNLEGYSALLIGPGLGNTVESRRFLETFLTPAERTRWTGFVPQEKAAELPSEILPPMIIDADGLNILSEIRDWHRYLPANTILTPHPGEMARLTGLSTTDINANRYEIAIHWAQTWNHIVLLKGANTIIASPEGTAIVLPFSNPGLSTAGTGDVLAGTIAAMLSQGLNPFQAAVTGAYLHGLAGEICRRRIGTAGMIAGDVAGALAEVLHRLE